MSYNKQGINYGIGQLSAAQIDADLTFLRQHFDYIRITYPAFNSSSIAYWQDVVTKAKSKGFYVMWGIYCPQNATADWFKFLQAFIDLSSWAATNGVVFGVNEEMYHNDDSVVADDHAIKDLHQAAKMAKAKSPSVKLAISLAGDGELDKFIAAGGKGAFDFVCLNQYGTYTDHENGIYKLTSIYGGATRVTEFSTGRGFDAAFGTESSWKADIKARADFMQSSPVAAFYFYTYDRNTESNGKWNMRTGENPNTHHEAWDLFKRV